MVVVWSGWELAVACESSGERATVGEMTLLEAGVAFEGTRSSLGGDSTVRCGCSWEIDGYWRCEGWGQGQGQ